MHGAVAGQQDPQQKEETEDTAAMKKGVGERLLACCRAARARDEDAVSEGGSAVWCPGARYRPEPPEALARASHFTPHEIKLMYRGFKQECPTGMVDEEAFKHIFSQFFPLGDASQYAHFVFNSMKHKQRGKLNFEEFLDTLSRVARGSRAEKLSWVFALYDADGDGRISRAEMLAVVRAVYELLGRAAAPPVHQAAAEDHVDRIFHLMDTNADGVVTPDELARWCARDPALLHSLDSLDTVL